MTDQFEQLFGSPLFLAVALGQSTDTPEGSWLQVRDRDWRLIEIADCGAKLCGSIVKTQSVFNYTQTHKVKQRKKKLRRLQNSE
ncbi:DUF2147 domain-containing protein [Pseudovibrio denitrificans]|uniref:DUF2147 domain-containing protein n=1 Tax=Pseudovibrio denitrificans TaxID=258256 RepID=UPI0006D13646|nr:DUF2147 domain-containing protein [Pseudovibrio denitrificans]